MSNLIGAFVVKKITSYEGTKVQNYYDTLVKKRNYTLVPSYEGTKVQNCYEGTKVRRYERT